MIGTSSSNFNKFLFKICLLVNCTDCFNYSVINKSHIIQLNDQEIFEQTKKFLSRTKKLTAGCLKLQPLLPTCHFLEGVKYQAPSFKVKFSYQKQLYCPVSRIPFAAAHS